MRIVAAVEPHLVAGAHAGLGQDPVGNNIPSHRETGGVAAVERRAQVTGAWRLSGVPRDLLDILDDHEGRIDQAENLQNPERASARLSRLPFSETGHGAPHSPCP